MHVTPEESHGPDCRRGGNRDPRCSVADPLACALHAKVRTGAVGATRDRTVAAGAGWRVADVVCTCGPRDRPFEERQSGASVSLVLAGTFVCRSEHGVSLLSAGSLMLVSPGQTFECSHAHGEGDRCLSFQFDAGLFERLARQAGAPRAAFDRQTLPPLRGLSQLTARATAAMAHTDALEEIAVELAGAVVGVAGRSRREPSAPPQHHARIARVLRLLGAHSAEPHSLADLARRAGLSPYHFLRTFKRVAGVTPHQWLLRARLREAARRLTAGRQPVTDIALDVGFEDLSNFTRTFRAEFGTSPRRYRLAA
jgi:AraC family transcriptional regulator